MSAPIEPGAAPVAARPRQATGTSLAAIVFVLVAFAAVMGLHVLRRDIDPLNQVMSEYANGSYGFVMTAAFYAFGLSALALAYRLRDAIDRRGAGRAVPPLLAVAGTALLLSGVFEVGRPQVPDTIEETIHSLASVSAFLLLIAAMLLFSLACRSDARWWTFRRTSTGLALAAAAMAMASPLADATPWSGLVQRSLGLPILAWLLLTAIRIRTNAFRPA